MAVTTVLSRAVGTATSTAGTSKPISIPSGYTAGDLMVIYFFSAAAQPDATPSGWSLWSQAAAGSGFYSAYFKKATSGDISAGVVTFTVTAAGKAAIAICGFYATSVDAALMISSRRIPTVSESTHALAAIEVPGPATVVSFLGMKDGATASGSWTGPAGFGTPTIANTTGSNQAVVGVAITTGGDVGVGTFGTGAAWAITAADGVTAVSTVNAVVNTFVVCAVLRPTADVTVPSGTTFTGGSTMTQVTADDDFGSFFEFGGTAAVFEVKIAVNGTVPNFVAVDMVGVSSPTSTSVTGRLYLGATLLLTLGTDSTLIGSGGYQIVWSATGLTSGQKTSILADPTNLRLRCTCSVA